MLATPQALSVGRASCSARRVSARCAGPRSATAASLSPAQPRPRRGCVSRCASAAAPAKEFHVLVKAEIPVHLPRPDFLKQLFRWAVQYVDARDDDVHRPPMRVEVIDISPTLSIGFTVSILKYTESGALVSELELEALMDEEVVQGYDVVGMDKDGFPLLQTMDGEEKLVKGKYFLVRRDKSTPVPAVHVETVKALLENMMSAVNKYYAFGSCFSEEF